MLLTVGQVGVLPVCLHALQAALKVHARGGAGVDVAVCKGRDGARPRDVALQRGGQRAARLGRHAGARGRARAGVGIPEDAAVEGVPEIIWLLASAQRRIFFFFSQRGARGRAVHRNQAWSPSPPCVYVLPCRHARQVLSLRPAASASASNCPSAQTMSPARVLDELGSEASSPAESMHADEQGELGVTWRAAADTASSSGSRRRRLLEAMMAVRFFFFFFLSLGDG